MLTYTWIQSATQFPGTPNFKSQLPNQLLIFGDGASTSITINLQESPIDLVFNNNFPIAVNSFNPTYPDPSFSVTLQINKAKLIVSFNQPMSASQVTRLDSILLVYKGE